MYRDLRKSRVHPAPLFRIYAQRKEKVNMTRFAKSFSGLAAVALLCLCPLLLYGQDTMQNNQSGMAKNTMSTHHMVNVTGCLKKGTEDGGYYITDKDGTMWELSSKTVNLAEHVNHIVSISGHEMPRSQADEAKVAESEKSESGGSKYADLKVAQLKMVSESCSQ
jgi:hypothetical protein